MGLSAWPLSRYSRCRPSSRTSTTPTSRSTRRCLDTCGCARPRRRTRSLTGRSPEARASRISRRRGSATALNASAVVAARATPTSYTHIGISATRSESPERGDAHRRARSQAAIIARPERTESLMSDLVAIAYPDLDTARQVASNLQDAQKAHLISLEDAVIVERQADGKVKLHQPSLTAAGAAGGALWGGLIGLIFLVPVFGMAIGAASGALAGRFSDGGVDDE